MTNTPLGGTLTWTASENAKSYRLKIRVAGEEKPVLDIDGIQKTSYRLPLCPDTDYEWTVTAVNSAGGVQATNGPFHFSTPGTTPREVTDNKVLFAGVHPGSHWQMMEEIPADPSAKISPWYYKKSYDHEPPPTVDQVKDKLPIPVWDGHEDLVNMYWYAWKTLFSVWLFAPPSNENMAVSNVIGLGSWGPWGSTMVWDTAFILQFARYGHFAYPFITGLDNCYARQHENGFICRESDSNNHEVFVIYPANPPLLAWSEWQYYQVSGDVDRLRKVFLPLVKQYEWYMLYQRRADGLYWTQGFQEADDSPRNALAHSTVSTTSIQAMSADILSKMAMIIGREDMAGWFEADAKKLKQMVNDRFWDADHRLYNDLGVDGKSITETKQGGICKHVHMFWPMLAGIATPERAGCLATHLADPGSFNRTSGTASLSADSDGYNKENGNYWKGAVWPPTQYMVIKGLERCGNDGLAYYLSDKYVNSSLTAFKALGDITEYLAPDQPVSHGCGSFVGWGGLAPIALFIENILGFEVDAPANTVTWRIRRTERHGIKNLRFGKHTASFICEARTSPDEPYSVTVDSDSDFDLIVDIPGSRTRIRVHSGQNMLNIDQAGGNDK